MRSVSLVLAVLVATGCEPLRAGEPEASRSSTALEPGRGPVFLSSLGPAPLSAPEVFLEAAWGRGDEALARELVAARTGPMAIAAELDGGLAVLDTVAGRVHRFDAAGRRRALVQVGVETGDDLALLPGGAFAVLAYGRLPEPHHVVLRFDAEDGALGAQVAPRAATLPTALAADGDLLLVEQRHGWLHPLDGSARLWGRPAGELLLRAELTAERGLRLRARERQGGVAFEVELAAPWPITELVALEAAGGRVAVVVRRVDESRVGPDEPAESETWLVLLDSAGGPLGRTELVDSRVTDAGRPFALGPGGDFFELVTTEAGVRVLRYRFEGGRP